MSNYEVGQEVIYMMRNAAEVLTVKKVTPSGQVTAVDSKGRERRFTAKGEEVGEKDGWYGAPIIKFATPEEIAQLRAANHRKALIANVKNVKFEDLTNEQLAAILKIVR